MKLFFNEIVADIKNSPLCKYCSEEKTCPRNLKISENKGCRDAYSRYLESEEEQ